MENFFAFRFTEKDLEKQSEKKGDAKEGLGLMLIFFWDNPIYEKP